MAEHKPPFRLRIPAALAITVFGAGATIGMSFVGCEENIPEPVDAGRIFSQRDAAVDADELTADGRASGDARRPNDAGPPDTPFG